MDSQSGNMDDSKKTEETPVKNPVNCSFEIPHDYWDEFNNYWSRPIK